MLVVVDDEQFLDPPRMEQATSFVLRDTEADGGEIGRSHQLADRLGWILGEADIAVGDDASQLAGRLDDRDRRDAMPLHQRQGFAERLVDLHGHRVDDHAALEALDLPDGGRLLLDGQVAMQDADAAGLRHDDRHVGFGNRVHRRTEDRNAEPDLTRDAGAGVGF